MDFLLTRHSSSSPQQEATDGDHGEWLPDGADNFLPGAVLAAGERLQVHMDCMNAVGAVVAVEDVDDMGGSVSALTQ